MGGRKETSKETAESTVMDHAALMAHQVRSPLASANSLLLSVLGEYVGELSDQQKKLLRMADERMTEANDTINRILEIARPVKERSAAAEPADLAILLQQAELDYLHRASGKQITLTLRILLQPALVAVAPSILTEAINALVNNAIKYTPDHGTIEITLSALDGGRSVRLSVADSGIGVPEDQREKIFAPFYRTDAANGSNHSGVGLGLAFVKSLVDRVGGALAVEDSPLGGAAFILTLPAFDAGESAAAARGPFRVVIIGGVTAGPKAASKVIRLRENAEVTIIERGEFLSYAGCGLPYYISGTVREQGKLMCTPAGVARDSVFFRSQKNVRVRNRTEAVGIDREGRRVQVRDILNGDEEWVPYDALLLATGAVPIIPPLPGCDARGVFRLHGVRDAEGIRLALAEHKARDVVIVGGGLIGVEITEALASRGCRITMLECQSQILGMLDFELARLVERHMESNGVKVCVDTCAQEILVGEQGEVTGVRTDQGAMPADMVVLAVGVRPNTALAKEAGLKLCGITQAVAVDAGMRTSDPHIFAAGDCTSTHDLLTGEACYVPLGSTATKQGRIAAINICGGDVAFPGVLGSTVCKVFDFTVARTGLTESVARRRNLDVLTVMAPGPDRAQYMPESQPLYLKLLIDRDSHRILGAQAVGPGDGAKRIDMAAMAITNGMRIEELAHTDLCYAPPYSAVIDNLITAANIAQNKLDGLFEGISAVELQRLLEAGESPMLLDVRTAGEFRERRLAGATSIPLSALRGRLYELPKDRPIVIYGEISLRGYEAALVLQAGGMEQVKVLDGGLAMWPFSVEH
ncbi:MAG: FAD-dependent oxidoreductase [Planctomycetota bacterium]|jgi:NADPH-dependent 2,4-dienoyl-CoA reductase/sulfur reductase-like enzyme/rhodanese-related sulfurtransferase/two-component sensor histidine kinase